MIRIEEVYKNFGNKKILNGVNLDISKGENMVILGGSGSGKSVLIKHLVGLLKPDSGRIYIEDQDITVMGGKKIKDIRKKFGMLFQGAALFDSLSVEENVGFSLVEHTKLSKEEIHNKVREKLAMVGLTGIEKVMPAELSGGMRKRVGLARAIAIEPEILLYDEPTTGLDPIMADKINDLIVQLRTKLEITSVIITHDMISAFKISDRLAMLFEGKIIFVGTPSELIKCSDPYVKKFLTAAGGVNN